ncbi:MAG TPA: SDR family NAD(P)-dependent oxidoreductase [Pseudolysinimonas sp.]|nr:SDR family NAD(P)-dependent oxidoreductase [Pseudolysinimonas sp.]
MTTWDPHRLPQQHGRTIVVTGGNAGVGYFTSEQLAAAGAHLVLASRSRERAQTAMDAIWQRVPDAQLTFVALDLTSLASIARAADQVNDLGGIDVLINNAGLVTAPTRRTETADGLELLVGGNAIGHFALTAQLFPSLRPGGRVVGLGSMATRMTRLDADDLMSERRYSAFRAYGFSKHAVHGFAFELDRRLRAAGDTRASLLAHPGFAVTGLAARRPGITDISRGRRIAETTLAFMAQGKDRGAWPSVRAASDPDAVGGSFYGPSRTVAGPPVTLAPVASRASPEFGERFWRLAERASGVAFAV